MGNLNLEFEINYDLETVRVVADHASGTALFTSGSTQITGSDAANWTSALEGRRIRNVTDGRDYTIAAIGPTPQSMSIETPYTGTTTGQEAYNIQASMHSANSFYSFLQDIFDETIQMDDEIPMSAQTPTEYTMLNGWFMDDRTSNFISGGAIQTSGLSGAVRQANFGVAGYTNAIVGDIGLFVTGTTTADTARLLDFDNSRRVWWLKVTGTVNDEFQDPDEILVVSGGTGQGTLSQKTFTGENVFANLFSIGSVVDQTQAYVFQTGSVITPWWPDESVNKMDVIVKTTEMGIERSGSNVTVFTRRYGNTYDHFTLAAPGGRNPVVLNTAADAFNTTDRNTIDALTVVSQNNKTVSISRHNHKSEEKLILEVARMVKIGLLQQNSFDDVDTYCSPEKQFKLMKLLVDFYQKGQQALKEGTALSDIRELGVVSSLLKARMDIKDDEMPKLEQLDKDMQEQFKSISGVKVSN